MRWPPLIDRLLSRVICDVQTRCWNYSPLDKGYGYIVSGGKTLKTHRVAFEMLVRPIGDGIHLHHKCENPACCNPDHLQPVTPGEHNRISPRNLVSIAAAKTHCPKGHPLVNDNLVPSRLKKGHRCCLTCQRAAIRAQYYKDKEKWNARIAARRAKAPESFDAKQREYARLYQQRKRAKKQ